MRVDDAGFRPATGPFYLPLVWRSRDAMYALNVLERHSRPCGSDHSSTHVTCRSGTNWPIVSTAHQIVLLESANLIPSSARQVLPLHFLDGLARAGAATITHSNQQIELRRCGGRLRPVFPAPELAAPRRRLVVDMSLSLHGSQGPQE